MSHLYIQYIKHLVVVISPNLLKRGFSTYNGNYSKITILWRPSWTPSWIIMLYHCFRNCTCIFKNFKPSWLFWYIKTFVYIHRPVYARKRLFAALNGHNNWTEYQNWIILFKYLLRVLSYTYISCYINILNLTEHTMQSNRDYAIYITLNT